MKHYLLTFLATLLTVVAFSPQARSAITELPYESTMNTNDWKVIDVNNDGNTWKAPTQTIDWASTGYPTGLQYTYNSSNNADDWVISPAIHLEAGKVYKVSHWGAEWSNGTYYEKYEFLYGKASSQNDYASLTNLLYYFDGSDKTEHADKVFKQFTQFIEVEEDGDYYFGFHCISNKNTYYAFITGFFIDEYLVKPGAATEVSVTAGEDNALKAVLSWTWPTVDGEGLKYTGSITGANIYRSEDPNFTANSETLVASTQIAGTPSEAGTYTDEAVPHRGTWYYQVKPYDENGVSPSKATIVNAWIGPDAPKAVTNVVAALKDGDDTKVSITWDEPAELGEHDKPVDLSEVYYKIVRVAGRDETVVATAWKGQQPYEDTLESLNVYEYRIYNVDADGQSLGTTGYGRSNTVTGGGEIQLPYSNTFDTETSTGLLTIGQDTDRKWEFYNDNTQNTQSLRIYTTSGRTGAIFFLPAITFEEGQAYRLAFDEWTDYVYTTNPSNKFTIRVVLAKENSKAGFEDGTLLKEIIEERWVSKYQSFEEEVLFNVPETGKYYIAFQDYSNCGNDHLFVDNIVVEEFIVSPRAPENLKAVAADDGSRSVVLSWTNPTKGVDDSDLTTIQKIEIYRSMTEGDEGELVAEYTENLTPGAEVTYTDSDADGLATDGYYYYTLRPYLNDTNRESATAKSTWVGSDEIGLVSNVKAVNSATTPDAIDLTFDLPKGVNGGWVNFAGVTYKITRRANTETAETTLTESFDGNGVYTDLPSSLNAYVYKVYVVKDGVAETSGVESNKAVGGGCAELPYSQGFDNSSALDLFTNYNVTVPDKVWTIQSNQASLYYSGTQLGSYGADPVELDAYLVTPQFQLDPGDYRLRFKVYYSTGTQIQPNFQVLLGQGTQPENLTTEIVEEQKISAEYSNPLNVDTWFHIDEAGRYNIAFRCHDTFPSGVFLYLDDIKLTVNPTAPAVVTELTTTPDPNGAMKVTLNWKNPSETNKQTELSEITKIEVRRLISSDFVAVGTIEGDDERLTPGAVVSFDDESFEEDQAPGTFRYQVVAFLNENPSDEVTTNATAWVGEDTPGVTVANLTASISEENNKWVNVNFDYPKGTHSGYVDVSKLTFKIEREKVKVSGTSVSVSSTQTLEEAWNGELPYVDNTLDDLAKVRYNIYVNGGSTKNQSNVLLGGGVIEVPYENALNTNSNTDILSISGSRGFTVQSDYMEGYMTGSYLESWAITPPIYLEEGKAYEFAIENQNSSPNLTVKFDMFLGTQDEPTALGVDANSIFTEEIANSDFEEKSAIVSVPETGLYYLGIHGKRIDGGSSNTNFRIKNLRISVAVDAPLAVEDLNAVANENGENSVTLSWTNPTKLNNGLDLTENITVKVFGEDSDEAIETLTDVEPGSESEIVIEVEEAGIYKYTVIPYLEEAAGRKAVITTPWIGVDTSYSPAQNVKVTLDSDGNRVITFDPATGYHGGYIDMSQVSYDIYRGETLLEEGVTEPTYTDTDNLEMGKYVYGVITHYGESTNPTKWESEPIVCGIINLPYEPDYTNRSAFEFWDLKIFNYTTTETNSSPGSLYSGNCSGNNKNAAWAVTPPFKAIKGSIILDYIFDVERSTNQKGMEVYLLTDPSDYTSGLKVLDYPEKTITGKIENSLEIDIPETGIYYIAFHALSDENWYIYIKKSDIRQGKAAAPGVPEAAADLAVVADETGGLSAVITWTTPDVDAVGQPIDNVTSVKVLRDGEEIATVADVTSGEEASYTDDSIEEAGLYTYSVIAYADEVEGWEAKAEPVWIGPDALAAPERVSVNVNDENNPVISFPAVVKGINGGYIHAENVTYNIYRGEEQIAQGQTETSFVDNESSLEFGSSYTYGVQAVIGEEESDITKAAKFKYLEIVEIPYYQPFTSYEVVNNTWTLDGMKGTTNNTSSDREGILPGETVLAKDGFNVAHWAVSSPIRANEGKVKMTVKVSVESESSPQDMDVYLTTDPNTRSAEGNTLIKHYEKLSTVSRSFAPVEAEEIEFEIPSDGIYYIAFNPTVVSDAMPIYISQFDLEAVEEPEELEPFAVDADNSYEDDLSGDEFVWTFFDSEDGEGWTKVEGDDGETHLHSATEGAMAVSHPLLLGQGRFAIDVDIEGAENDEIHIYLFEEASDDDSADNARRRVNADTDKVKVKEIVLKGEGVEKAIAVTEELRYGGVYYVGFESHPADGSEGVKLHSVSVRVATEDDITGIDRVYTDGSLIYNKAIETILIPAAGHLEVYSTNGMLSVSVDTEDHVNVSSLVPGTYIARFVDTAGKVATLKFVK